ncbi:PilC/PilY family type IV pilus protein [Rhodanobacter sp. OK091]|uniref:pilus assembly protein n=1 Tax=Rhodanobacter sp. OK091 TaxID=1881037 RepID=UPI000919796D|nr:PilC/PilY family type IV pilus protein [Rhodanobacter sp. OK091]SHL72952.1 type IV pilus assembly protein PilY1 [Rhodanobacter sp. OK091]
MPHARIILNHRLRIFVLIAAALVLPGVACGEDIDLYTAPGSGGQPNVILLLDSSSAWNGAVGFSCPSPGSGAVSSNNAGTDAGFEQCALYNALTVLGTNAQLAGNINVGLMRWDKQKDGITDTGATYSGNGGYFKFPQPQAALLPVIGDPSGSTTSPGAVNLSNLLTIIKGIDRTADGANSPNTGGAMQEVWAYYTRNKGLSGNDYSSLAKLNACQKNFVIYIANAMNNGDPNQTANIWQTALVNASKLYTFPNFDPNAIVPVSPLSKYQGKGGGPEWARYMDNIDLSSGTSSTPQNIITYTIAVTDGKNPEYVNYVQTMAANGGGKSFVININDANALEALIKDLTGIFNEVQATNSVFASVSLPVSVNAQGTSLNQVYVGMFRPDATTAQRWAGNLKQYQLGFDANLNVQLEDSLGNAAITNSQTGFITPNALSYWTADHQAGTLRDGPVTLSSSGYYNAGTIVPNWPSLTTATATTPTGFWVNLQPAAVQGAGGTFDVPDGQIVDKGGVAEMIRADYLTDAAQANRVIYTCPTAGCTVNAALSTKFDAATLGSSTAFNISSTASYTAQDLINWVRGKDNITTGTGVENPKGPGGSVTVRPSIHGDVLHSRPAVVNYGGSVGIVAFYGSNDGFFRAVNGNQDATFTTVTPAPAGAINITNTTSYVRPGSELWSFIAPQFFSKLKDLHDNTPQLTLGAASSKKDYFFDGTTTVYQNLRTTPATTYIYVTARRGGRLIYAFDVSDPTLPKFLWSRTNADIPVLGQTWSQPKLALVKGNTNPVVIMGGGYDTNEDTDPATVPDTMGNAIVVLDAFTGNTVWTACPSGCTTAVSAMTYAIPADITLLDSDGDAKTDRLYAADLGGNIWRADIDGATPSTDWKVTQIAKLSSTGNGTGASCASTPTGARKFFYPPDVTQTGNFDAVVAASGDREHPLLVNASSCVVNRFYMLKDTSTGKSVPSTWTTITESMLTDETGALTGGTPYPSTSTTQGFFINLGAGEKAVNAPLTVAGYTYFGTNTPTPASSLVCSANLGIARGYAINFLTGAGLNNKGYITFDGGGMPPSPVFGLVEVTTSSGVYTPVLIGGGNQTGLNGGNNSSSLGANKVTPPNTGKRKRTYWFTEGLK